MKITMNKVLVGLVVGLAFALPLPAQAASDGSLTVDSQTIYDNGRSTNSTQRDYGVKTLWAGEREQRNQAEMKAANQVGAKADQVAFVKHQDTSAAVTKHNDQVLATYVFGGKYTAPKLCTAADQSESWWGQYHQVIEIGLLMTMFLLVGGWLGRQFASYKQMGGFTWQRRP